MMWMVVGGMLAFLLAGLIAKLLLGIMSYFWQSAPSSDDGITMLYLVLPLSLILGAIGTKLFYKTVFK